MDFCAHTCHLMVTPVCCVPGIMPAPQAGEWGRRMAMSVKVIGVNQEDKRFPWCPVQKFPFKSHWPKSVTRSLPDPEREERDYYSRFRPTMIHPRHWGGSLLSGRGRALSHPPEQAGVPLGKKSREGVGVGRGRTTNGSPHHSLLIINPDIFRFLKKLTRLSISGCKYSEFGTMSHTGCLALCPLQMRLRHHSVRHMGFARFAWS